MFEKPCSGWLGGGDFLWRMQHLPGSWAQRDSGVRGLAWLPGTVIAGKYPTEALYKKVYFGLPGPRWAPKSAFGSLALRVGSATVVAEGQAAKPTNLLQILQRVRAYTTMGIVLFLLTEDGELLATSLREQLVERREPRDAPQPGKIVGLLRGDDPVYVHEPVRWPAC